MAAFLDVLCKQVSAPNYMYGDVSQDFACSPHNRDTKKICVRQFCDHLAELYDDYDGSNRQLAAVQEYKEKSQR